MCMSMCTCVWVCVHVYGYAYMCMDAYGCQKWSWSYIIGVCELPDMGTGNQTLAFCKSSNVLTRDHLSSPQSPCLIA